MALLLNFEFDESAGATQTFDNRGETTEVGELFGDAATDGSGNLVLDGSGDHAEVAPAPAFGLSEGTIILSFTADPAGAGRTMTLFSVDSRNYDGGGHLTIGIRSNGTIEVRHQTTDQSFYLNGGPISYGQPVDLAYSFGPSGSTLVIDGVEQDTNNQALTLAGDVEPLVFGAAQTHSGDGVADDLRNHYQGEIQQVQIHDEPLAGTAPVVCFARETLIETPSGPRPAGSLKPGDLVNTRHAGAQRIRAVSRRRVGSASLAALPHLRPVVFATGAIGNTRRLRLSRQHCVAMECADGQAVLVRAAHLARAGMPGVRFAQNARHIVYVHFLLEDHALVRSEGIWSETLWPGSPEAQRLASAPAAASPLPPLCHPVIGGQEARRLAAASERMRADLTS